MEKQTSKFGQIPSIYSIRTLQILTLCINMIKLSSRWHLRNACTSVYHSSIWQKEPKKKHGLLALVVFISNFKLWL